MAGARETNSSTEMLCNVGESAGHTGFNGAGGGGLAGKRAGCSCQNWTL